MIYRTLFEQIKSDGGRIPPGKTLAELTEQLLPLLGSRDGYLRDDLALELLWGWVQSGLYSSSELVQVGCRLRANLQQGLGQCDDDSVFLRAFSVLLLSVVVRADNDQRLLSAEETRQIAAAVLNYFQAELDWRGRDVEHGWIHAVAHVADCFLALAYSRHLQGEDLLQMLQAVQARLLRQSRYLLLAEEDERLARAVRGIISRGLINEASLSAWFSGFRQPAAGVSWKEHFLAEDGGARDYLNCKQFLRSLYWQCRNWADPAAEQAMSLTADTLAAMQFYQYDIR